MSDIYKIGMQMSLTGNLATGMGAILQSMTGIHGLQGKIEKGFKTWNTALIGIGVGGGILLTMGKLVQHAKELSHELATLKTYNLSEASISGVQKEAQRLSSGAVRGTTQSGNVKLFGEAYSLFGEASAKKVMEPLARFGQVFGAITGDMEKGNEKLYELIRSGELMGKLVNEQTHLVDTDKLLGYLDLAAKVSAATHGKVGPAQIFALAQQGGPALANMGDEGLLTMFMAAQDMGGNRAGTALTALYQQMIGGQMTKTKAEQLKKLGLVGDFSVGKGGHVSFAEGALNTPFSQAIQQDPLKAMGILKEALEKNGVFGNNAQTKALFEILGRQTTQRLVSDLLRNMEQKSGERGRIIDAQGVDAQSYVRNAEDMKVAEHNLSAAWKSLMEAISGPNAQNTVNMINMLTSGLEKLTTAVNATDPKTIQAIALGFGAIATVFLGAGIAAMIAALGPAGAVILGVTALGTAIGLLIDLKWDDLTKGINWLGDALSGLWDKIKAMLGIGGEPDKSPYRRGSEGGGHTGGLGGLNPLFTSYHPGGGAANDNGSWSDIGQGRLSGTGAGSASSVDLAQRLLGSNGSQAASALGHKMTYGEWCADFVNGVLAKSGGKGTGSSLALSYSQWGKGVRPNDVMKGDVFVENHGRGHGHVGFATGKVMRDAAGNVVAIQTLSGNHGHKVGLGWDRVNKLHALRRGVEPYVPSQSAKKEELHIYLDGDKVEHHVTRRQVAKAKYPTAVGGHDSYGNWADSGMRFSDVG